MADNPLIVDPKAIPWAHTVLFQSLIVQLIDAKVLSVENAQRVFDIALQRASKQRERLPDAERLVQYVHDNFRWDDLYKTAAAERGNKVPSRTS
jgi:hypothetical protein